MPYGVFLSFSIIGTTCWISVFVFGGYFFGNIPIVKNNFTAVILGIIFVSIMPGLVEFIRHRYGKR
jgi:membrane-associated protein